MSDYYEEQERIRWGKEVEEHNRKQTNALLDSTDFIGGGLKSAYNYFKRKNAEREKRILKEEERVIREQQEIARYQAEAQEAKKAKEEFRSKMNQIYDLYNNGKISDAINICDSYKLELVALIILYKQGNYKEALARMQRSSILAALCHDKLGEKQKTTEVLLASLRELLDDNYYKTANFSLLQMEISEEFLRDTPFDVEMAEIVPLVTARIEEGNKDFFKYMGDIYRYGIGREHDNEKAKEWYSKGMESNDKDAYFTVAKCVYEGLCGYQKDEKLCIEYLKKAETLGHRKAKEELRTIAERSKVEVKPRHGFVSFIFSLVIGIGICLTAFWVYQNLSLDNVFILTAIILISLIVGMIITYKAWRYKKTILFIIMLALAVPGVISQFGGSPSGSRTERPSKDIDSLILLASTSNEPVMAKTTEETAFRLEPNGNSSAHQYIKKGRTVIITGKKATGTFISRGAEIQLESAEVKYGNNTGWITVRHLRAP
ncbi:MAG: hypothetical protein FWD28_11205 [Treponema sp.]|nr:hypothetical protein [Treponema sp.]